MKKTKTKGFYFKCSPEEMEWIERRMSQTNITNKSAYLRKMAIDGRVINLDIPILTEIGKLLRNLANNMNQLTKRVNGGGSAYRSDVEEINNQVTIVREYFGEVLTALSEIDNTKLGKNRFIAPPTIRDLQENRSEEGD
jgi:6-phosphogluconate dehydrogenase (decarboxylating)